MSTKSTTEKKNDPNVNYGMYLLDRESKEKAQPKFPSIESQESYWRTKEADLSLDKVEATTDYIDHFLDGNTDSDRPFPANETEDSFDNPFCNYLSAVPVLAEPLPTSTREPLITKLKCDEARESKHPLPTVEQGTLTRSNADSCGGAQNFHLSLEAGKGSTVSKQQKKWKEPEWTLRDEVGESFKEIP